MYGPKDKRFDNCKADTCGKHEHADSVTTAVPDATAIGKFTKHSDWDDYFWGVRCSNTDVQSYRLNDTNTRANWASVNKKDVNDLKTANGKTAGLKKDAGSKDKCKAAGAKATAAEKSADKKACDTAKKNLKDNTDDVAKLTAYLAQNQAFRVSNDESVWWAADIKAAQGKDST